MPTQYKRGTNNPLAQNESWDYTPTHGYTYRVDFKGMSRDQMLALQQDYVTRGVACRLTYLQGGNAYLEVDDSTQQYTLDVWQVDGGDERLDLFVHPIMLNALTDDQAFDLRARSENNDKPSDVFGDGGSIAGDPAFSPFRNTAVERLYSLYRAGVVEFENDAYGGGYVLIHTTNAPNRWAVNVADFGVGKVYTPAKLLSEAQNSGLWSFPMPGRLVYKLGSIPSPGGYPNRLWGWKKGRSQENTAANNRIEIVTRYQLELWQTDLYTPF